MTAPPGILLAAWFAVATSVGAVAAGPQGDWVGVTAAYDRGDYTTAQRLIRSLAEGGDPDAQYDLAVLYHIGEDVPQDNVQAYRWYEIAASRFPDSDASMRDRAIRNRDRIAAGMTPAQITEARKLAREWKPAK